MFYNKFQSEQVSQNFLLTSCPAKRLLWHQRRSYHFLFQSFVPSNQSGLVLFSELPHISLLLYLYHTGGHLAKKIIII